MPGITNAQVSGAVVAAGTGADVFVGDRLRQTPLGAFAHNRDLALTERELIAAACAAAENAYIPRSNYPVGAAILAQNSDGKTRIFRGCNVENRFLAPTICAERTAATAAVAEGHQKFLAVAVFSKNRPGGSPCGLCRQVLIEFGAEAVLLNISDHEHNVYRGTVSELLPGACRQRIPYELLAPEEKAVVDRCLDLRARSYVPYSRAPRAAIFTACDQFGTIACFEGVSDDNASYGGSATAECVAMRTARTAGFGAKPTLVVTIGDNPHSPNPIDGEALQVLREFGLDAKLLLVADDRFAVFSDVNELFPDSFGPDSLV